MVRKMPSMTTPGRAVSWVSNWMLVRVREVAELGGKEKTPPAKSGGMVVRGTPKLLPNPPWIMPFGKCLHYGRSSWLTIVETWTLRGRGDSKFCLHLPQSV